MNLAMTFIAAGLLLATGCSGGTADLGGGAGDGGPTGPSLPRATPIATGLLEGVWDVTGAAPGSAPVTGTVEITPTRFSVEFQPSSLTMTIASGSRVVTVWRKDALSGTDITTTRSPIAFDPGAIPLPVGGMWSFASPNPNDTTECAGNLSSTAFQGGCNKSISGKPSDIPSLRGSAQANKTSTLPSSFGDFSGRWEFTGDAGGCVATFEQNTITWACPKPGGFGGQATLAFTSTTASGTTSTGMQLSALKR